MSIQQAIKQAQMLQQKVAELQKKLEDQIVTGTAGGGSVKVTCTGKGIANKIEIDPSLLDKSEKEMLEDLIVTAFNNAKKNADDNYAQGMRQISGSAGIPMDLFNSAF